MRRHTGRFVRQLVREFPVLKSNCRVAMHIPITDAANNAVINDKNISAGNSEMSNDGIEYLIFIFISYECNFKVFS